VSGKTRPNAFNANRKTDDQAPNIYAALHARSANSPGFVSNHIRYKQGQEQTPEVKRRVAALQTALRRDRLKKQFGRDWRDTFYKGAKTHEQKAARNSNMPLGTGGAGTPKSRAGDRRTATAARPSSTRLGDLPPVPDPRRPEGRRQLPGARLRVGRSQPRQGGHGRLGRHDHPPHSLAGGRHGRNQHHLRNRLLPRPHRRPAVRGRSHLHGRLQPQTRGQLRHDRRRHDHARVRRLNWTEVARSAN
jgi:hypothetical protein